MRKIIILLLASCMLINTGCNNNIIQPNNITTSESTMETSAIESIPDETNDIPNSEPNTTTSETTNSNTKYVLEQSDVPSIVIDENTYFAEYGYGFLYNKLGVYEFDDDITMGAVSTKNLESGSPDVIDYEAFFGLKAYTKNQSLFVTAYNHSIDHTIKESKIVSDIGKTKTINIKYDTYTEIKGAEFANGLYCIETIFDDRTVSLYFYVNDSIIYTVRCMDRWNNKLLIEKIMNTNEQVSQKFKPEDCLNIDDIVYPCIEAPKQRCDTERWAQLSHDLLGGHYEWSDEFKVFVYTQWLIQNTKYDKYRSDVIGCSRAKKYNIWDGTYSMWDLKVGVCCDYTNVMVIMCREQGIPCTSLETDIHMWNAIYIDGKWREHDITTIMQYASIAEDASDCIIKPIDYTNYMNSITTPSFTTIGADIWTYNRAMYGHQ